MHAAQADRATAAAMAVATASGLEVETATVLNDSNRLVVHLAPCDTVARVTPASHFASAEREVALAALLADAGGPIAPLDPRAVPRVVAHDGFHVSLWAAVSSAPPTAIPAADYGRRLEELHASLRQVDVEAPHVMDRVSAVQRDVANHEVTPELGDADRALLSTTLRDLRRSAGDRRADEQHLHGEPHPWNVLDTADGLLFIDLENTALGPVEYDLAWAPAEVAGHYPDLDHDLVDDYRGLVLAIVAAHRWRHDDHHPSGRPSGVAFLDALRAGPPWPSLDAITW